MRYRIKRKQARLFVLQERRRWWPFWSDLYYSTDVASLRETLTLHKRIGEVEGAA